MGTGQNKDHSVWLWGGWGRGGLWALLTPQLKMFPKVLKKDVIKTICGTQNTDSNISDLDRLRK
jgi:hypothetical protein